MTLEKTRNLPHFENILTFTLARGFDLVLSLGVTVPLITPVMGISWPCILGKECFDMVKTIGFGDLVRLFSSSRRSDRVYLGWFVWDSVWRLFRMQASRWSVKLSRALVLLAPLLALGSKSTSLSAGIHMWAQAARYDLFSSAVFLPYFSMLILSLPVLELVPSLVTTPLRAASRARTRSQV